MLARARRQIQGEGRIQRPMTRKERQSKDSSEEALVKLYPLREEKARSLKYPLKTYEHNYDFKF